MNSHDFIVAAGEAICEWGKAHHEGCIVFLEASTVLCSAIVPGVMLHNNPLLISSLEVARGLTSGRWNAIGTELHNLYTKELACRNRHEP